MKLYKYTTSKVAIEILSNQKIRFTQPIAFNDPFDAYPFVVKLYTLEEQRILAEKIFSNKKIIDDILLTNAYKTYPQLKISKEELLESLYSYIEKSYGSITNFILEGTNNEEELKKIVNLFITNLITLTGILSLTKDPENLLMWAHYADCHRGIVIEFDGSHPFFNQSDNNIYPTKIETNYSEERPKIEFQLGDFNNSNRLYNMFSQIYFTKSINWKYESEYRVVRRLDDNTNSRLKDGNGYDIHLFNLPSEIIKSIIIGNKTESKVVEKIKKILAEKKYNNVSLKRIELDNEKYLLHINSVLS